MNKDTNLAQNVNRSTSCKLFRRLSGLTVSAYAAKIGVSHTYWKELESGIKSNPSLRVKQEIAALSGLSLDSVEYLLQEKHLGSEEVYAFLIDALESYIQNKIPKE